MATKTIHVGDRVRIAMTDSPTDGPFARQVGQTGTVVKIYAETRDYRRAALVNLDETSEFRSHHQQIAMDLLESIDG